MSRLTEVNSGTLLENGTLPSNTGMGGYPLYYLIQGDRVNCPACAEASRKECGLEAIVAYDVHWEGIPMICDNCNGEIESAYGDPTEGDDK